MADRIVLPGRATYVSPVDPQRRIYALAFWHVPTFRHPYWLFPQDSPDALAVLHHCSRIDGCDDCVCLFDDLDPVLPQLRIAIDKKQERPNWSLLFDFSFLSLVSCQYKEGFARLVGVPPFDLIEA